MSDTVEMFRIPPSWDYDPTGFQFELWRGWRRGNELREAVTFFATLPAAIVGFVQWAAPRHHPSDPTHACVMDGSGTMVLGYSRSAGEHADAAEWVGVRVGFLLLEKVYDPLMSMVWETIARENLEAYQLDKRVWGER